MKLEGQRWDGTLRTQAILPPNLLKPDLWLLAKTRQT